MLRIFAVSVVALFLLGGAAAPSGGGGHGGGGHGGRGVVTVYVPGRYSPDTGDPAFINLTFVGEGAADSGVLSAGAVMGVRTARAEDAIVLTEGVNDGGLEIAAGTVMVRMSFRGQTAPIWCTVRQMPELHPATTDCVGDARNAGRVDEYWTGYLFNKAAPFSIVGLSAIRSIRPAAYRPAKPEEMPTIETGYAYCPMEGAGVALPHLFISTIRMSSGQWLPAAYACPFGEWFDPADKSLEVVDGLRVKIEPGAAPRYRLLDVHPQGPLAAVYPGQTIRERSAISPQAERAREIDGHSALEAAGEATKVAAGAVAHGDDIALVPVRHGYTGVLKSEVRTTGLMGRKSVPAGQFVYGVPTRDISDPKDLGSLTWCAPQVTEGVKLQVSTVCFTSDGVAHYWFPARSSLMVTQFYHGIGYLQVSGLSVQRTSTPFPIPMTLAYVFDQWIRLNGAPGREIIYAQLGVEIRINGVMTPIDHIDIPLSRSQRFCMPFMNGALAFTPVDHAGAPVALPTSFSMPNANVDLFFDEIAANRARVEIVRPPHGVAPLRVSNQSGAPVPDACRPAPLPITLSPPVFAPTAQAAP